MTEGVPSVVELFAGCGGLAVGLSRSGFRHLALIENDKQACETLKKNAAVGGWDEAAVMEEDAKAFDFSQWAGKVTLCAAGVPCQPFSNGGLGNGHEDHRNLFPALLRAVRQMRPQVVLVENVFGLLRPSFEDYFKYILDQLRMPEFGPNEGEGWRHHWARLRGKLASGEAEYSVDHATLQAANFGTPQLRRRVFIQSISRELRVECLWPGETHSSDSLALAQSVGAYWVEHGFRPRRPRPRVVSKAEVTARWSTVRDAISGLGPPSRKVEPDIPNHRHIKGARTYDGHTGSRLDSPAKTLKAGVHGVAGGEGTMICDNGKVRYFSVREAARIQDFEDDYWFPDVRTVAMRQIGNAVPVRLATALGSVASRLVKDAEALGDEPCANQA